MYTSIQKFGVKLDFECFWKKSRIPTKAALFEQKYIKNTKQLKIVIFYCIYFLNVILPYIFFPAFIIKCLYCLLRSF